jgi:hypothetical protein
MTYIITTHEVVWIENTDERADAALPVLAAIAVDPASLTYEQLLSVALASDEAAAAWLLEDLQAA